MSDTFTLYYTPGACSISPHIALREARAQLKLEKVDLRQKQLADGGDWMAINPKGYVPALRLPDGEILTEGAVIVQYIADQFPDSRLAPMPGTIERVRHNEWLHYIATELHKGMAPLFNTLAGDDYKKQLREVRFPARWALLAERVRDRPFLTGDHFTVADGYAFYTMRAWQHSIKASLEPWPELVPYYQRIAARPAVQAALEAEGLKA